MTWHLFYVEAETNPDPFDSTVRAFLVSAQGESPEAAQVVARAMVTATIPGTAQPCGINHSRFVGVIDRRVFDSIGLLAA